MKILVADDDPVSRLLLQRAATKWGYEVFAAVDGTEAWTHLESDGASSLAILDWAMPGVDGVEICRRVRAAHAASPTYLILLTGRGRKQDMVAGLQAGADDYLVKPFDQEELRARVQVGARVIGLQRELAAHVRELEQALQKVKVLDGLLPICSYCKKIRDDQSYWHQVEAYVGEHSRARFSHGICPDCYEKIVKPEIAGLERD